VKPPNLAKPEPKRVVYTDGKEHRSEKSVFLSIRVYKNFSFLAQKKTRISLAGYYSAIRSRICWQSPDREAAKMSNFDDNSRHLSYGLVLGVA